MHARGNDDVDNKTSDKMTRKMGNRINIATTHTWAPWLLPQAYIFARFRHQVWGHGDWRGCWWCRSMSRWRNTTSPERVPIPPSGAWSVGSPDGDPWVLNPDLSVLMKDNSIGKESRRSWPDYNHPGILHLSDWYTNSRGRRDLLEHDNPATRAPVLQAIEELARTSRTSTELRDKYEVY
jgi:hypothetical protein